MSALYVLVKIQTDDSSCFNLVCSDFLNVSLTFLNREIAESPEPHGP